VTALQSADEFAGTADEDPVLSTINPTTMIVPAIIDRITLSLVGAAPTNQYPRSPAHHAVADCIGIKYRCPKNFD
jgi:hypothetical protein